MKKYLDYINERQWWMNKEISKYQTFIPEFKPYKYGDNITFEIPGFENKLHYRISSDGLISRSAVNNYIYQLLDIKDIKKYCDDAYGYSSDYEFYSFDSIPRCKFQDFNALTRLVIALKKSCHECRKFIDEPKCNCGDIVTFRAYGKDYVYSIESCYLSLIKPYDERRDIIFIDLNIEDKYKFCSEAYGYTADDSMFPCCAYNDCVALRRLIDALKRECEKTNKPLSRIKKSINNIIRRDNTKD